MHRPKKMVFFHKYCYELLRNGYIVRACEDELEVVASLSGATVPHFSEKFSML